MDVPMLVLWDDGRGSMLLRRVIDASGNVEEVSDRIWSVAEPILDGVNTNEIRSIL